MDSKRWQFGYILSTITLVITVAIFIIDGVSTQRTNVVRQQMIEHRMNKLEASNNSHLAIMRSQNKELRASLKNIFFKLSEKIDRVQDSINRQ